jgi:hypothetical protein
VYAPGTFRKKFALNCDHGLGGLYAATLLGSRRFAFVSLRTKRVAANIGKLAELLRLPHYGCGLIRQALVDRCI